MAKKIIITFLLTFSMLGLTACQTTHLFNQTSGSDRIASNTLSLQGFPNNPAFWQANTATIWYNLQRVSLSQLQSAATKTDDPNANSWIKLAIIGKQYSTDTTQLVNQLMTWRAANPNHTANTLFPENDVLISIQNTAPPKHIVLLLPLQGNLSTSGQAVRDGFLSVYYSSRATNQAQTISFLDTTNQNITALYQHALTQNADAIVGPLTKEDVQQLVNAGKFPVPTIALNYTDSWFRSLPTHFYEFGLSPLDEAKQLAEKAKASGHKRALLIAPNNEWGQRVAKTVIANWSSLGGTISDTLYFNDQTDLSQSIASLLHVDPQTDADKMKKENNKNLLEQQRRQDFDVIFSLAPPENARQILPLLKYYYTGNIPVFSTSIIYSGVPAPQKDFDLNGVIFCDTPWILQMANNAASAKDIRFNRLYAVGRDAYLLSNQMTRLIQLPNFPIYGATGALTLTSKQQIYRRLAWTQIHDGRP